MALLSTQPADLPLPRTAFGRSFNLLALRARCEQEPTHARHEGQDTLAQYCRTLRRFSSRATVMTRTEISVGSVGGVLIGSETYLQLPAGAVVENGVDCA